MYFGTVLVIIVCCLWNICDSCFKITNQWVQDNYEKNTEVKYVGAVLEYQPFTVWDNQTKGFGILKRNAESFVSYAFQAKTKSADILITPEYGLQGLNMMEDNPEDFVTFTQFVPDPEDEISPCDLSDDSPYFKAVKSLSCGSRSASIYMVIGLAELSPCDSDGAFNPPWGITPSNDCPESGYFVYNTQVVFDRQGKVIARYRKQHLYLEEAMTPGSEDDTQAIFETDFGVTFTLQICFDIVFEHPAVSNIEKYGIKDVAMSTAWVDQLPFDLANSIQSGWNKGLGVNLLVSGYHQPENYKLGTGIFKGYSNDSPVYTYDKCSGNVLVISSITTKLLSACGDTNKHHCKRYLREEKQDQKIFYEDVNSYENNCSIKHSMLQQSLSNYTKVLLNPVMSGESKVISKCHNSFCCSIKYQFEGDGIYCFMVFNGSQTVGKGKYVIRTQQCAVVRCQNQDLRSCGTADMKSDKQSTFGPFSIYSSNFKTPYVYPSGNFHNYSLLPENTFHFESKGKAFKISTSTNITDFLVAALYGRIY